MSAFACGDDGSGGAGGGTGGGAAGGNDPAGGGSSEGGGGGGTDIPSCEELAEAPGAVNDIEVDTVTASAEDENGDPIASVPLQLCGKDYCLYANTSGVGTAAFTNDQQSGTIDRPVLKPGDSLEYGKIGYPYDPDAPPPLQGVYPAMNDSGTQFAPGETVSADGVELTMPADGGILFDIVYDEPAKQTFRAAHLEGAAIEAATGSPDFVMLYTLGPYDTVFCPGASVTFDNYGGLAADTEVEFYGQVLSAFEYLGGYGEWVKIGEGVVSGDGATVTTDAAGLEMLLTVAIKAK
ncbi:MAG: hypothetical protein JNK04_08730 [Myxococcales bacterium]|nr:hypothetical protein [Myxococcales bacterium]